LVWVMEPTRPDSMVDLGGRPVVDFRAVKAGVQRLFAPGHPLREALLREPDQIGRDEARNRLAVYLRLACAYRRT